MNTNLTRHTRIGYRLMVVLMILVIILGQRGTLGANAQSSQAPLLATNTMSLVVKGIDGSSIGTYKYLINIDNTGTTTQRSPDDGCSPNSPGYPDSCNWVSIAGAASYSPIYTQGDQTDFSGGGMDLPDGHYLISVLADGYKMDGIHFTVPLSDPGTVTVLMQPAPLPTATIQAAIFEDISPTNSGPDVPIEHGLAGFVGHIADYIGEVTTDVFGDPLCGTGVCVSQCYVVDGGVDIGTVPPIDSAGRCPTETDGAAFGQPGVTLTVEGKLIIPNLGPNRYALSAVPPDGSSWIQTTTLEGNHDWDAWVMEGATGLDTEFVVAGEPFPATFFGFVQETDHLNTNVSGSVKGMVAAVKVYVPATGGVALPGDIYGGLGGGKVDHVIGDGWVALSDLGNGDTAVYIGPTNADGSFDIQNVPDGTYTLSYWDEPQDYILNLVNVTVNNGEMVDMGVLPLNGWWTTLEGHVFLDSNSNGKFDPGEQPMSGFPVAMRKRENSLMDRGAVLVSTDAFGYYFMENAYPMTQWLVMEAYSDLVYTTGITYQADNQSEETTVLGQGVDVNVLPIIGLSGRLDWGVKPYAPGTNGGIVGTVSYDTTRNELDPRFAAVEDWQPGIPDMTVNLYLPVDCGTNPGTPCDALDRYELAPDGSIAKGLLVNSVITETWERPIGCVARDVDGNPLVNGVSENVLPLGSDTLGNSQPCLEGPLMGVQFGPNEAEGNFGAAVNGNYGFGDACFGPGGFDAETGACADGSDPTALTPGDYLVEVISPLDALGRPMYKVTREEDINIANGDEFIPQIPPPECVGPLHTVDVLGFGPDGPDATDNPTFLEIGASPYEGLAKPLCNTKLVRVSNQRSVAPTFNFFTDVPLPGRFWGLLVDDLNFSSNPRSLLYGEKAGVPFAPVGIYDYTNRLVATVESDYNGLFDVLLPSTNRISCPTPSGVCANLYRFVGNDPGIPGKWNSNYNPQFRTISAEFEAFPGLIVPADLAPTQVGVTVQLPGGQSLAPVACMVDSTTPQLFAVSKPYTNNSADSSFTIYGQGFGATAGQVLLDGAPLPTTAWSDTSINVTVPAGTAIGPRQLSVKSTANGQPTTINGLTFHVFGVTLPPFPATGVLDAFTTSSNSGNMSGSWGATTSGSGASFFVVNNTGSANDYLRIRGNNNGFASARWNQGSQGLGTNQEAYFTFRQVSTSSSSDHQGLMLKWWNTSGSSSNVDTSSARWIEVAVNKPLNRVDIYVKTGSSTPTTPAASINGVTFANGEVLGARALSDGSVRVYKNGALVGSVNIPATAAWSGRIGIRFEGTGSGSPASAQTFIDDFGGGNVPVTTYQPNVYEVGPGKTYATIQGAVDAAATSNGDDLVVVYPGNGEVRLNPLHAYYENLIITSPIKLQGVGPGGVRNNGSVVEGSVIDGAAFGGDTALADAWRTRIASLTWDGNQTIAEGQTVFYLAQDGQFTSGFKASIDGFTLRGGDQMGFPNNINVIGGGPTGLPPAVETQGGAIFANAYARYLQITNNLIQNNGGAYGTVRIGTPNLPQPETNQHNENIRIANNRIVANGGTNLAGGIGLFAGSDSYEVAYNDLCGNFSAEYGGGLTAYGYSPNGKIHDNRIYFNRSYDEGAGIMIAGELPSDPAALSPGTGPVSIYNNLIQANLSNDDGGGIRFLMAGNFPMNVYNNIIANNISTHEGGGIAIDDAPDLRIYNNTIVRNITTATAITSNGFPAPAGISTGQNSDQLQATLLGSAPIFSSPVLFNNIFWDNRAGTRGATSVSGISASDANVWNVGVADGSGTLNSSASDFVGNPLFVLPNDIPLTFVAWRTNTNFIGALMVTADLSPSQFGNYHLQVGSPAINFGTASVSGIAAPVFDIDGQARPAGSGYDAGADEVLP